MRRISPGSTQASTAGFNVVLVSVDTLRADHVGCYGHKVIKTPNIDRFAAEGTRFANCTSSVPLTLPPTRPSGDSTMRWRLPNAR